MRPDKRCDWIDAAKLKDELGINGTTLKNWIDKGILPPPVRMGRSMFWRPDVLQHFTKKAQQR